MDSNAGDNDEISSVLADDFNISGVFDLSGGIIIVLFEVTIEVVVISFSSDVVDIEHITFEVTGGIKQYVRFIQTIPFIPLYSLKCEQDIFSLVFTISMILQSKPQLMSMKIFNFDEIYIIIVYREN